ncbi:hypothetical protein OH77DRAFT_1489401, partial [Trametes cingulata]
MYVGFTAAELAGRPVLASGQLPSSGHVVFVAVATETEALAKCDGCPTMLGVSIPLQLLLQRLPLAELRTLTSLHGIRSGRRTKTVRGISEELSTHVCVSCPAVWAVVETTESASVRGGSMGDSSVFPPSPLSPQSQAGFMRKWVDRFRDDSVHELACGVCACLVSKSELSCRPCSALNLSVLDRPGCGVTRKERVRESDPEGAEVPGPIIYAASVVHKHDGPYMYVCAPCLKSLKDGKMPCLSLANGRWIGDVPSVLQGLSYAEELLIARFRRNYCVAHVKGGQRYLKANAILFEQPVLRVYDILPPPRKELEDCFAI